MNKRHLKIINEIANVLPKTQYAAKDRRLVKGEDLILANQTEIDGEPVDPDKEYLMHLPMTIQVNHTNRIKKAFKRHGRAGVIQYVRPFIKPEMFGQVQLRIFTALS